MNNQNPEWLRKAQVHNALTILNLSLFAQPLVIFGILYWVLDNGTDYSQTVVIGLSALAAVVDFLLLVWIIRKVKGKSYKKDNTIG